MEIWKDVIDFEGYYQISNLGRVKSLRCSKEMILKGGVNDNGYKFVVISNKGKSKLKKIHQLVAEAFLKHKTCGMSIVVNHIDFDKKNNNSDNLELVSNRENTNQKHLKSTSKYVGVSWVKRDNKWRSDINVNRKTKYLGTFNNELDASKAYEQALSEINKQQ